MRTKLTRYVYTIDAEEEFYERLDSLHEAYVDHLMMSGVSDKRARLDSIKMTKHPYATLEYCKRVVGALMNIKPEIVVKYDDIIECCFTKVNDGDDWFADDMFMVQVVIDYPKENHCSYQVWHLGDISYDKVKEHWT